jgi:predicted RNA methylase
VDSNRTVSCDLGAGNGLQGLLLQLCHPAPPLPVQVELSGAMVAIGRRLQQWLGIAAGAIEWIEGDVRDVDLGEADFIYLYRPMRPKTGAGRAFYSRLADTIATSTVVR